MKFRVNLVGLTVGILTTLVSLNTAAHEGHDDEDMIIPNLGNLGEVRFPVSCSAKAQQAANTGVSLLHHMMYAQAEQFFNTWSVKEPSCAMFYWGYSMSLFHPLWPDSIKDEALARGHAAIEKTKGLKTTAREQDYIAAIEAYYKDWKTTSNKMRTRAWAKQQQKVYANHSHDIDAAALHALSTLVMASKNDKTFKEYREAGILLDSLRPKMPTHPGLIHYAIHAYDSTPLAKFGIEPARAYDKIAPEVPHALHMPSHVFVRLGLWEDVISWNIRSASAALKYPTKGETSMHYSHALDYLVYGYLQTGDVDNALKTFQQLDANHPIQGTFPAAYAMAAMPARIALEQKDWQQAQDLKVRSPEYIDWDKFPQVEAITYYTKGLGAARNGDLKLAQESINTLESLYKKTAKISPNYWAVLVKAQKQTVQAWVSYANGEKTVALDKLRAAADLEDSLDKNPVTPGAVLPSRELLGDMLSLNGDKIKAAEEYKANLVINPGRRNSL